jgi:hypothetical protein
VFRYTETILIECVGILAACLFMAWRSATPWQRRLRPGPSGAIAPQRVCEGYLQTCLGVACYARCQPGSLEGAEPVLRAAIVRWAENQPDMPTLSEATRRLVEIGLKAKGAKP